MKRFYVLWFFVCAAWGHLVAQPFPDDFGPRSLAMAFVTLPVGALSIFMLLAFELWRHGPNYRAPRPSLSLKPWSMPLGPAVFVPISFLFIGVWAVAFAIARDNGQLPEAVHTLFLGGGALLGVWGVYRVFPSRFAA